MEEPCFKILLFRKTTFYTIICLFFIMTELLMPAMAVAARRATLDNIVIGNTRDELISYFTVRDAFTEGINDALLKGVPASFSFFISIYQKRDAWLDKKIISMKISNTLKYNTLKQEFTLIRPWESDKAFVTKSLEQAKIMMCDISNLAIAPLDALEKGEQYQIRIKAEMNRVTLPFYLHYLFFFISLWDFETDWYKINIIY